MISFVKLFVCRRDSFSREGEKPSYMCSWGDRIIRADCIRIIEPLDEAEIQKYDGWEFPFERLRDYAGVVRLEPYGNTVSHHYCSRWDREMCEPSKVMVFINPSNLNKLMSLS